MNTFWYASSPYFEGKNTRAVSGPRDAPLFLCRLQNSYTASQRTNQELEDKLHTLVIGQEGCVAGMEH